MQTNNKQSNVSRRIWPAVTGITALVAIASAVLLGLPSFKAEANNAPAVSEPRATPVSVAVVAATQVNTWDEFSGRLEAVERVDVRSRVAGAVLAAHFREGALVKQGDLLITIDPAPYAAEVERAEAQVASAQARAAFTRSEQERARRLWDDKAIAQRELDERVNAGREAEASLRAAQAQLQSARLNLGYTQVKAPVSGRVGKLEMTVGNLVAAGPGAPVLTTLVSVSPIYASFDADEQVVVKALKELPPGAGARGKLDGIPVQMGTLIPGQFARIRMGQARADTALLVSERAVGTDQNKKFVMVVGQDNKAEWREVTLGAPVNGLRVVTKGLKAGERVVVNGLQHIRPGALVAPQEVTMDAKADARGPQRVASAAKS
jgi:multidrug efflux system membrane fusion protein